MPGQINEDFIIEIRQEIIGIVTVQVGDTGRVGIGQITTGVSNSGLSLNQINEAINNKLPHANAVDDAVVIDSDKNIRVDIGSLLELP